MVETATVQDYGIVMQIPYFPQRVIIVSGEVKVIIIIYPSGTRFYRVGFLSGMKYCDIFNTFALVGVR